MQYNDFVAEKLEPAHESPKYLVFFLIIMSKIYLYLLLISLFYKIIISKK
jgi:hypothetical protein